MANNRGVTELASFPGYGVDADGVVYCRRPINGKGPWVDVWREVSPLQCSGGRYLQVSALGRKPLVHRLVAEAFLGPCPDGMEVAHLNGDSHDNRACNLTYAAHCDNEDMKRAHGTFGAGQKNTQAKLTEAQVSAIRSAKIGRGGARRMAEQYGVSEATISMIRSGKRWAA